jgi:hypothetical protein
MDDGSGEFQTGSFTIDEFLVEDGNLVASGLLKGASNNTSGAEVTLPINNIASTCNFLEMQVGPPEGGIDPIEISVSLNSSSFSREDMCNIRIANSEGDLDTLVSLLNQEGTMFSSLLGGCAWYDKLSCSAAIVACGVVCANVELGPEACVGCLSAIGSSSCICCVTDD